MYRLGMDPSDPRRYLWANITELMHPQKATIDAVCARTGVARGNVQRIKEGQVLPSLDTVQRLAAAFGLHAWQLLVPGVSRNALPTLMEVKAPPTTAIAEAREPAPPYPRREPELVLADMAALLASVPQPVRSAFADVLAGWARVGGDGTRSAALLALLRAKATP